MNRKHLFCLVASLSLGALTGCSMNGSNLSKNVNGDSETAITQTDVQNICPSKFVNFYHVGDYIDYKYNVVTAILENGGTRDITKECTFDPAQGTQLNDEGVKTVTINHAASGKTCQYNVDVGVHSLEKFEVTNVETSFKINEPISFSGLQARLNYNNGTSKDVTSECAFSIQEGTVFTEIGLHEVVVTHPEGGTYKFKIYIGDFVVEDLAVSNYFKEFLVNEYVWFNNNLKVFATTEDHLILDVKHQCRFFYNGEQIASCIGGEESSYRFTTPGIKEITCLHTLTFKTTTFKINIVGTNGIYARGAWREYFNVGDTFDSGGLRVKSTNYGEVSRGYTTNYDGRVFTEQDTGLNKVEVTYNGMKCFYNIYVCETVSTPVEINYVSMAPGTSFTVEAPYDYIDYHRWCNLINICYSISDEDAYKVRVAVYSMPSNRLIGFYYDASFYDVLGGCATTAYIFEDEILFKETTSLKIYVGIEKYDYENDEEYYQD